MTMRKPKTQRLKIYRTEDESPDLAAAKFVLRPTVQNAVTLAEYDRCGLGLGRDGDLNELVAALQEQTKAVNDGALRRGEVMLTAQAHTLDAIFNVLARRAALNMSGYLPAAETYLKLAFRAQSQCRAVWEAISAIKNPPLASYVGQANIAQGPQQVNNETSTRAGAPARKNRKEPNELLEIKSHEKQEHLDRGAPETAGRRDSPMETVGGFHGADNNERESECLAKRV